MTIDDPVRAHLEAEPSISIREHDMPSLRQILKEQVDRNFVRFGLPGPAVATVLDHHVAVAGGQVTVRAYQPLASERLNADPIPGHILLHGGAWNSGSIDELVVDASARHRAAGASCVVLAVGYRLAPEFPFPNAVNDVIEVLRWTIDNCVELGIDPGRITVGGASAGANLAAAAVLGAPEVPVAAVMLEVPALDLTGETVLGVLRQWAAGADLTELYDNMAHILDLYLPDESSRTSPLASPLLASDLSGYPPTYIFTAELDPLRTEAELFAERLEEAGVAVSVTCYPGAMHGSGILTAAWPTARQWQDDVIASIGAANDKRTLIG